MALKKAKGEIPFRIAPNTLINRIFGKIPYLLQKHKIIKKKVKKSVFLQPFPNLNPRRIERTGKNPGGFHSGA